jgi:hypothetical protein
VNGRGIHAVRRPRRNGRTVALVGTLRDRIGPVVTFGEHTDVRASHSVEVGELPADFDPAWSRDNS